MGRNSYYYVVILGAAHREVGHREVVRAVENEGQAGGERVPRVGRLEPDHVRGEDDGGAGQAVLVRRRLEGVGSGLVRAQQVDDDLCGGADVLLARRVDAHGPARNGIAHQLVDGGEGGAVRRESGRGDARKGAELFGSSRRLPPAGVDEPARLGEMVQCDHGLDAGGAQLLTPSGVAVEGCGVEGPLARLDPRPAISGRGGQARSQARHQSSGLASPLEARELCWSRRLSGGYAAVVRRFAGLDSLTIRRRSGRRAGRASSSVRGPA